MSIAIGFVGSDGIVLATDSRLTLSSSNEIMSSVNDYSQKIWRITENIGCTSIGSQEGYRKWLIDEMAMQSNNISSKDFKELYIAYIKIIQNDALSRIKGLGDIVVRELISGFNLNMLIGGYESGMPKLICVELPSYHGLPMAPDVVIGYRIHGKDTICEYWIRRLGLQKQLQNSQLPIEILKSIAAFVISETITHVPYIGGDIQMATITENEGFKIIGTTEIKAIQAQIENRVGFPLIADWICQS